MHNSYDLIMEGFKDYDNECIKLEQWIIQEFENCVSNNILFFFNVKKNIKRIKTPIIVPNQMMNLSGHFDHYNQLIVIDDKNCYYCPYTLLKKHYKKIGLNKDPYKLNHHNLQQEIKKYSLLINFKIESKNKLYVVAATNPNNDIGFDFLRPSLVPGMINYMQRFSSNLISPFGFYQIGPIFTKHYDQENMENMEASLIIVYESHKKDYFELSKEFVKKFCAKIGVEIHFKEPNLRHMPHYSVKTLFIYENDIKFGEISDHGSYDFEKYDMSFSRKRTKNKFKSILQLELNKDAITKRYGCDSLVIFQYFQTIEQTELASMKNNPFTYICVDDKVFTITQNMYNIKEKKITIKYESFKPCLMEISFDFSKMVELIK